ncbi:MAG: hypothetical protein DMG99_10615 [Acidobacteria bacterium]|nr:MAG: hypothetical protein DMG99_10615 [Acidobacteriota bacterium]
MQDLRGVGLRAAFRTHQLLRADPGKLTSVAGIRMLRAERPVQVVRRRAKCCTSLVALPLSSKCHAKIQKGTSNIGRVLPWFRILLRL